MACDVSSESFRPHVGYVGDVKSCLPEGHGVYTYHNTFFKYDGDWQQGIKEGIGKLKMNDGSYYEGQFSNGEIDGSGKRYWSINGNVYEGEFEKGELSGSGVMKYGNGDVYEGSWHDNKRHGEGVLTKVNGEVYEGSFYYHKRHGEGEQKYVDGGMYKGGWINDMRHGHGVMMFKDGSIYEGQWKGGEMHGEGSLTHSSQITYNGLWNNGRPLDEPVSMCILGEQEIVLDQNEMAFSLHVECRTAEDEVTTECGRFLKLTAGVHLAAKARLTSSRTSGNATRNDTSPSFHNLKNDTNLKTDGNISDTTKVVGKKSTPFGFDVDSYPVYTKLVVSDQCDATEDVQSTSTTPISVETPFKDGTPSTQTPSTPISQTPPTPIAKIVTVRSIDLPSQFEYVPVTVQQTIDGKVSFLNLVLPTTMDSNHSTSIVSDSPETFEGKPSNRKKEESNKVGEEHSSGNKRKKVNKTKQQGEEKTEEITPDTFYKAGDYVIIIEDVTESPFLDITMEPIFIQVKVPVPIKKIKSSRGATREK